MEKMNSTSSQGGMENSQTYKQGSYAGDHRDHHIEEGEMDLRKEGEATVEVSPTGWKVTSRWDKHNRGIKLHFSQDVRLSREL